MARQLRIEFPGAVYHITSRGNERRNIFRADRDRKAFLGFLAAAVRRFHWRVTAWVLMSNHFHLVLETPEANLSRGMQWLNGSYAGWFNHQYGRVGHLFQGRFKSFLIEKEAYLAEVLRYVVLNPVHAGMVERPEAYRWSSYRATAGLEKAPDWLDTTAAYRQFGQDVVTAQTQYRDFVAERLDNHDSPWDHLTNGIYLGSEVWVKQMRAIVESRPRSTDHPKEQRAVGRPQMPAVIAAVAEIAGEPAAAIRSRGGGQSRRLAAWLGWHEGLLTLRSIAASLRLRSEGYVSGMIRRCEIEFGLDQTLLAHLDRAIAVLRA